MRIAISTSVMQRGRSGVGQYVLALVRALMPAAAQHEFTLFVLEDDIALLRFAASSMRIVAVPERNRPPVSDILWHQTRIPGLVRRHGIDILHVPSYRRMLWPRPCALVATVHDLAPFHMAGKYDPARMLYCRVVARRLALRQDRIITVSAATRGDVESLFHVPPERLCVIPNGLDHGKFQPGSQALAREAVCAPRGLRGPFFLYVARLEHPAKNHSGLIEAFGRFKAATGSPWRLALAGGDWHGADTIRALVRASPFARDIDLLGFVPPEDLPDWYRAADVFVFPSLFEGFGMPPIEAMACACPVLSSHSGALAETVGGAAGVLDPLDTGQIQAQLTRAATDDPWRGVLRQAGLSRARVFTWEAAARATLGVYHKAVAARRCADAGRPPWGRRPGPEGSSTQSTASGAGGIVVQTEPAQAAPIREHAD